MAGASLRQLTAAVILFGLLATLTHGRVVQNGYAFDAVLLIESNPVVSADSPILATFASPYWNPEIAPGRGLYRPLSLMSFQLTRRAFSDPVAVDHAIDLGLHVLCSLLLLIFLMQMGSPFGVALTLATVFLVHPVHTEVVASLVGRSDLLATLFALLALVLALSRRKPDLVLGACLFGLFSLSLLAKESAVGLVVALPACWAMREFSSRGPAPDESSAVESSPEASSATVSRSTVQRGVLVLGLCLGLAIVCNVALRLGVLDGLLVADTSKFDDGATGFFELRWRALAFMTLYAQKLAWPLPLLPDYLTGVVPTKGFELHLRAVLALGALAISLGWASWGWRMRRSLSRGQLGVLLFLVSIAPVSNLLIQIGTPFGERLLYFPMIFLLVAALDLPLWKRIGIPDLESVPRLWPVWLVIILLFGWMTAMRVPDWRDNRSLFAAAVEDCPDNYYSQFAYANVVFYTGRPEDRELAETAMSNAARLIPSAYTPRVALGVIAQLEGNEALARTRFEEAWERSAEVSDQERQVAALNLSGSYRRLEAFADLEAFVVPLVREHPEWSELEADLIDYYSNAGRDLDVLALLERAAARNPQDLDLWRKLIETQLAMGQDERASESLAAAPSGVVNYRFRLRLERAGLVLPAPAR